MTFSFLTDLCCFAIQSVVGERLITPGAIVQLVFKVRVEPPIQSTDATPTSVNGDDETEIDRVKREVKANEERDNEFLSGKTEAEELDAGDSGSGFAHAPYWPDVSHASFQNSKAKILNSFFRTDGLIGGY